MSPWCEASSKFGVLYSVVLQLGGVLQIFTAQTSVPFSLKKAEIQTTYEESSFRNVVRSRETKSWRPHRTVQTTFAPSLIRIEHYFGPKPPLSLIWISFSSREGARG